MNRLISRFFLSYKSARTISAAKVVTKVKQLHHIPFSSFGTLQFVRFLIGEWILSLMTLGTVWGLIIIIVSMFDNTLMSLPVVLTACEHAAPLIRELASTYEAIGQMMFPAYDFFVAKVVLSLYITNITVISMFNYTDILDGFTATLGADCTWVDKLGNVLGVFSTYYIYPFWELVISPYIAYKAESFSFLQDNVVIQSFTELFHFIKDGTVGLISDVRTIFIERLHPIKVDYLIYDDDLIDEPSRPVVEVTPQPGSSQEIVNPDQLLWESEGPKYFKDINSSSEHETYNCHPHDPNNHTVDDCIPNVLDISPRPVGTIEGITLMMLLHPRVFAPVVAIGLWYIGKAAVKTGVSLLF
jgi:hypothetical protein